MRLRHAVIALFVLTIGVLVGALYAAARTTLLAGFSEVEHRETVRNVERARDALDETLKGMSSKTADWAAWDDTCKFIADHNEAYVASNLTPTSLANLSIDSILFFTPDGALAAAAAIDPVTKAPAEPAAGLIEALRASGMLRHPSETSVHTGVLLLRGCTVLVASRPIVTSENEGPVRGSVVFARRLSSELIADFSERTHLAIDIFEAESPLLPADCRDTAPALAKDPICVVPLDGQTIAGYATIADARRVPGLVLRIRQPRDVYQQGLLSMRWLILSIVLVGTGTGAAMLVLLDRLVIARLERMSAGVERIGNGDTCVALPEGGVGELAVLASSINSMVAALTAASEQLDLSRRAAEAANRAKTEFLANMSHEIRTPMTAVLGYADLLADHALADSDRLHYISMIRSAGKSLLAIINDILDISKIEAGHLTVEQLRISPVSVVSDAIALLRANADAKGLLLTARCAAPVPTAITSDPARLRQILVNIIGNAIKFTPRGEVAVSITASPASGATPATLSITVSDTGPGMTPEQVSRLFKPFSQADSSTVRRFGGTGLGLCISKRLAEALGGTISVSSTEGRGTAFTIAIDPGDVAGVPWSDQFTPAAPASIQPEAETKPPCAITGRILLADDTVENQRLVALILRKAGAVVDVVSNGAEAVRAAHEARNTGAPYNLILLDMQMPVMDGYSAARRLRTDDFACPIVALTAFALGGEREKCLTAGCDDYAAKPIDRAALVRVCAAWLRKHAPMQPSA
jgi:signal transduction histidine kinase/ActR/RegA family two-component response regulator